MSNAYENLIGKTISRLATRQFWLNGQLSDPCAPLFIEDTDQTCWKLRYDDETWKWRLTLSEEKFPVVGSEHGDCEIRWRDIEPEGAGTLVDHWVIGVETKEDIYRAEATIRFENGSFLNVIYDLQADQGILLIDSGA